MVVLHLGCIDMKDYTDKLLEMVDSGKKETPKYADLCETVIGKAGEEKGAIRAGSSEMLDRLAGVAEERGVKLGIENRQALEEIPLDSDFELLLREFDRPNIGYWHDCGHAQIKENLGFIDHGPIWNRMAPRLLGFHVHDVAFPGHDHRAPGTGTIDYAALKPMVKPEHIKVFELSPSLSKEEAVKGVAHIQQSLGGGMKRLKACWSVGWRVAVCLLLLLWIFHSIFLNEGAACGRKHGIALGAIDPRGNNGIWPGAKGRRICGTHCARCTWALCCFPSRWWDWRCGWAWCAGGLSWQAQGLIFPWAAPRAFPWWRSFSTRSCSAQPAGI